MSEGTATRDRETARGVGGGCAGVAQSTDKGKAKEKEVVEVTDDEEEIDEYKEDEEDEEEVARWSM